MDNSKIMSVFERRTNLDGDVNHAFPRQCFLAAKDLLEIFTLDVLHRVKKQSLFFAGSDELNDARVLQF